jgi:hypothetical protein
VQVNVDNFVWVRFARTVALAQVALPGDMLTFNRFTAMKADTLTNVLPDAHRTSSSPTWDTVVLWTGERFDKWLPHFLHLLHLRRVVICLESFSAARAESGFRELSARRICRKC